MYKPEIVENIDITAYYLPLVNLRWVENDDFVERVEGDFYNECLVNGKPLFGRWFTKDSWYKALEGLKNDLI